MLDGNNLFEGAVWVDAPQKQIPNETPVRRILKPSERPAAGPAPVVEPDIETPFEEPWLVPTEEPVPTEKPAPRRNPFRPPRPEIDPRPQNRSPYRGIMEAYEDEAHPGNVKFFRSSDHPVLSKHGHDLATAAFNYTHNRKTQKNVDMRMLMHVFMQIAKIERNHKTELEDLAKDLVSEVWGIGKESLDPKITDASGVEENDTDEALENEPDINIDDRVKGHINMRTTFNMIAHGAAVHHMMTLHHMIHERLTQIDPQLVDLYDKLAVGSAHQYWFQDIEAVAEMLSHMKAGSVSVEYQSAEDEGGYEMTEEVPVVKARAVIFPVLVQELSKGVVQLISHHHLGRLDRSTTAAVLKHSDKIELEPRNIMVGPELWRRFLKVLGNLQNISHADALAALASLEPKEAHDLVLSVIENPTTAQRTLAQLVEQ